MKSSNGSVPRRSNLSTQAAPESDPLPEDPPEGARGGEAAFRGGEGSRRIRALLSTAEGRGGEGGSRRYYQQILNGSFSAGCIEAEFWK